MECCECKKKIPEFLNGSLPEHEQKALQEHLKYCLHCSLQVSSFKKLDSLLPAADLDIPKVDLTAGIMERLKNETQRPKQTSQDKRRRLVSVAKDLIAAAAAAMIIFWASGSIMVDNTVRLPAEEVVKVSSSVGGVFQAYIDFSASTFGKFSDSFKQIYSSKGDE